MCGSTVDDEPFPSVFTIIHQLPSLSGESPLAQNRVCVIWAEHALFPLSVQCETHGNPRGGGGGTGGLWESNGNHPKVRVPVPFGLL